MRASVTLCLLGLSLSSCDGGSGPIRCVVASRPSVEQPLQTEERIEVPPGATRTIGAGAFSVELAYVQDEFEGDSMRVVMSTAGDTPRALGSVLYQLDSGQTPQDQFAGGHGFTGLHYVYHPVTAAELQWFCATADPEPGRD